MAHAPSLRPCAGLRLTHGTHPPFDAWPPRCELFLRSLQPGKETDCSCRVRELDASRTCFHGVCGVFTAVPLTLDNGTWEMATKVWAGCAACSVRCQGFLSLADLVVSGLKIWRLMWRSFRPRLIGGVYSQLATCVWSFAFEVVDLAVTLLRFLVRSSLLGRRPQLRVALVRAVLVDGPVVRTLSHANRSGTCSLTKCHSMCDATWCDSISQCPCFRRVVRRGGGDGALHVSERSRAGRAAVVG